MTRQKLLSNAAITLLLEVRQSENQPLEHTDALLELRVAGLVHDPAMAVAPRRLPWVARWARRSRPYRACLTAKGRERAIRLLAGRRRAEKERARRKMVKLAEVVRDGPGAPQLRRAIAKVS